MLFRNSLGKCLKNLGGDNKWKNIKIIKK
jgi:hypothetical protein